VYQTNIVSVYLGAHPAEVYSGMHWYDDTHKLAAELSPGDVWRGAGVIAAYSPLTPWWRNKELAIDSLTTGIANPKSLGNSVRIAQRILDGEHPLDVIKGDKTRAFCAAIADPLTADIATVDSHAYSIAMGYHIPRKKAVFGKRVYREIAAAYSDVADMVGISTAQIQAITWVSWRNTHKALIKPAGKSEY
jgi:hypothetical protein